MKILTTIIIAGLMLTACSTKREYFDPSRDEIAGKLSYDGSLGGDIKETNLQVATLSNGETLDRAGITGVALNKGEFLTFKDGANYGVSNIDGNFALMQNGAQIYSRKFPQQIVAGAVEGNQLALIQADNTMYLINTATDTLISRQNSDIIPVQDSRIANPVFTGTHVLFPTLDGRIYFIDRNSGEYASELLISNQDNLNNIIYLDAIGKESLYVATPSRMMMIAGGQNVNINGDIRFVFRHSDRIFVIFNNGTVGAYDSRLNKLNEHKFRFAMFVNALGKGNRIYMLEKNGYVVSTNLDLGDAQIYKLGKVKNKTFATTDSLIVGNKYLKFE